MATRRLFRNALRATRDVLLGPPEVDLISRLAREEGRWSTRSAGLSIRCRTSFLRATRRPRCCVSIAISISLRSRCSRLSHRRCRTEPWSCLTIGFTTKGTRIREKPARSRNSWRATRNGEPCSIARTEPLATHSLCTKNENRPYWSTPRANRRSRRVSVSTATCGSLQSIRFATSDCFLRPRHRQLRDPDRHGSNVHATCWDVGNDNSSDRRSSPVP